MFRFCTVCEKNVIVENKVTKPRWWHLNKYKVLHDKSLDERLRYEREVCHKCKSELLIDEMPNFPIELKSQKMVYRMEARLSTEKDLMGD